MKRHLETCRTSGKTRFRDRKEALEALHALRYKTAVTGLPEGHHLPVRAYKCPDCSGWHLTSKAARTGAEEHPGAAA